jgi:hypothetical protein
VDSEDLCKKTGAIYIDSDRVMINYLNRLYIINLRTSEISTEQGVKEGIPLKDAILILHYLTQAKGTPLTNKLVTYAQIQGGRFYCPVFQKRTIEPILKAFGDKIESIVEPARKIGGKMERYGDVSVSIDPFPNIRFFIILWRGDDEIPSNGNILFDKNITDYLTAEDIVVLSETIIWKLINMARAI